MKKVFTKTTKKAKLESNKKLNQKTKEVNLLKNTTKINLLNVHTM